MMWKPPERRWHPAAGWLGLLAWGCLIVPVPTALADPVKNVRSRVEQPLAIRGGVLMLSLMADKPGDHWPDTLELTLADQSRLMAQVIWIDAAPPPMERQWTDDPRGLKIRAVRPTDDSAALG